MSKVLYLLEDYGDLLTYRHEKWIEEEMKRQEELEDENIEDDERFENYVNPDGDFSPDDIPF
jgi:hypothetical protein